MKRVGRAAVLIGVLVLSLALVAYGVWLLQLEHGARAAARGALAAAAEIYSGAERPFVHLRFLARLSPAHYSRVVFPQVALLYARGKTDEAIGKLERAASRAPALAEHAEFGFWTGNVWLRRALASKEAEVIVKNLNAAAAQYRQGLEAAPQDWDLKHNYELVQYILARQERDRKKEEARLKSILERIRTITEPGQKELPPPEKRG